MAESARAPPFSFPCLVWTNEESGDAGSVSTVTFEEKDGKTLLVLSELYPSKEALDAAGTGAADAMGETFQQLDGLLATLGASECDERALVRGTAFVRVRDSLTVDADLVRKVTKPQRGHESHNSAVVHATMSAPLTAV